MRHLLSVTTGLATFALVAVFVEPGRLGFDSQPLERQLYFKLPLEQPKYHWRFRDRDEFLNGKLTVRIQGRDGRDISFVVFEDGVISQGWRSIGGETSDQKEIYFGFTSTVRALTAWQDSIEIELLVEDDLQGIGPDHEGVLPAGRYVATGAYSLVTGGLRWALLVGKEEDPTAYLGCWYSEWPLTITSEQGWLNFEEAKRSTWMATALRIGERIFPERGTNGKRCVE